MTEPGFELKQLLPELHVQFQFSWLLPNYSAEGRGAVPVYTQPWVPPTGLKCHPRDLISRLGLRDPCSQVRDTFLETGNLVGPSWCLGLSGSTKLLLICPVSSSQAGVSSEQYGDNSKRERVRAAGGLMQPGRK